jgi:molybdopterin-synthase adenylyltransferase
MERYSRQIQLKEIGILGQEKLAKAHVVIIGCGALGTVAAQLLTRSGIGNITLVDRDIVELSNLQRQVLFTESNVGKSKAYKAKEALEKINSKTNLSAHSIHLNIQNIPDIITKKTSIVLDCTDNIKTRFLINDYCRKEKIPWIYSAAVGVTGSLAFISPNGPCLRCFLPNNAQGETCSQSGVLNTGTNIIASMQTTLLFKYILGKELKKNILTYYNVWDNSIKHLQLTLNPTCTHSGTILEDATQQFCVGKYQLQGKKFDLEKLKLKIENNYETIFDGITLSAGPITLFSDGRCIIKAKSLQEAESIYSRILGN